MIRFCPICGSEFAKEIQQCPYDGSQTYLTARTEDLVGRTLDDRYTILSVLGRGGMGVVYLAHQISMNREVAIKVLRRDLSDDREAVKRFLREAQAASRLSDPHTVTVFDFGQTKDGLLYIVMELLHGTTLRQEIERTGGHMPAERAISICDQALAALAEAHAAGFLHRDLKPENIFLVGGVATKDFVKVLDFGIVKVMKGVGRTTLTGTGQVVGTPDYMSPEQARGDDLDQRSDIYSIGVILFEMLAGKPPFQGSTPMAVMIAKTREEAPTIYHVNPELRISPRLESVLMRLLAMQPTDRPATAQEARAMLLDARDEREVASVPMPDLIIEKGTSRVLPAVPKDIPGTFPPTERRKAVRQEGRNRTFLWMLVTIGSAAVALVGAWIWFSGWMSGDGVTRNIESSNTRPSIGEPVNVQVSPDPGTAIPGNAATPWPPEVAPAIRDEAEPDTSPPRNLDTVSLPPVPAAPAKIVNQPAPGPVGKRGPRRKAPTPPPGADEELLRMMKK